MVFGVNGLTWVTVLESVGVELRNSLDHVIALSKVVEVVLAPEHGHK